MSGFPFYEDYPFTEEDINRARAKYNLAKVCAKLGIQDMPECEVRRKNAKRS